MVANRSRIRLLQQGVRRVEDPHQPRGYRELRSPGEMRKLLNGKVVEQDGICPICLEDLTDYNDVVPNPKGPKGMGGGMARLPSGQHPGDTPAVQ